MHELNFNPRTPSQECDRKLSMAIFTMLYFNPRTPSQECDISAESFVDFYESISIHALPRKNATQIKGMSEAQFKFQSTHSLARMRQKLTF